jgi:hypothetical protein
MNKYRRYCRIYLPDGNIISGEMSRDGLIFIFPDEIIPYLNSAYPTKDSHGWYFNSSKDRYVAERECTNEISVNPSFVALHTTSHVLGE